ncbi:hypothetical protein R6Q59_026574 [Mikania micrantha]
MQVLADKLLVNKFCLEKFVFGVGKDLKTQQVPKISVKMMTQAISYWLVKSNAIFAYTQFGKILVWYRYILVFMTQAISHWLVKSNAIFAYTQFGKILVWYRYILVFMITRRCQLEVEGNVLGHVLETVQCV